MKAVRICPKAKDCPHDTNRSPHFRSKCAHENPHLEDGGSCLNTEFTACPACVELPFVYVKDEVSLGEE